MSDSSSQTQQLSIRAVLTCIHHHDDSSTLRSHLEKSSPQSLQLWRDDMDYDLLHHAILDNNVVAAGTFFSLGLFKSPHEPVGHSYLHLACCLGHRSLVMMLLQERPDDNKPKVFAYKPTQPIQEHVPSTTITLDEVRDKESKKVTPLDLAAEGRHLACVKAILDFSQTRSKPTGKFKSESYTNLACKLDSPLALRLLLSEEPDQRDLNQAVALALKLAKPECLDTLLCYNIDKKAAFGGMNFFHVLFTYSYSFDKSWYESLVTVTSVLLRHGHPVHAFRPSRTYPLYSLISHTHFHDIERSAAYRIACLLLLLNSGADPNFDEVKVEELVHENEYETAFGRSAYSSALHCLFDTIGESEADDCDKETLTMFMFKCVEILLNHGADVNYVGQLRDGTLGTSLHALAITSKRFGIHNHTLLLLLRNGADPNIQTQNLPICTFCRMLFEESGEITSEKSILKMAGSKSLKRLLKGMCLNYLKEAEIYLRQLQNEAREDSCERTCLNVVLSEIENYTKRVWTLRRVCMHKLWLQCRRNFANIATLPLPVTLKTDILADVM